jgi:internalin A
MEIKKHTLLNMNPAFSLFRPLAALLVFLSVSSFPAKAIPSKETTTPRTFADWCLNKDSLSAETKDTVDAILQEAKTTDCHQADKFLSTRTDLYLRNNSITDLRPLSALTNLAKLGLSSNSISDLRPLSSLTNLTFLELGSNSIADLTPLSTLTNLTILYLNNNQIADLTPLSTLTDKTCPVKPESICIF